MRSNTPVGRRPESRGKREFGGALVEYTIVLMFVGVAAIGMSDIVVEYTRQEKLRREANNLQQRAPSFTQLPP